MEWTIAAPFVHYDNVAQSGWLELFIESDRHTLRHVPRSKPLQKWHDRKSKFTSLDEWFVYFEQAKRALQESADGVITVFPQLASAVGIQQSLSWKYGKPVVAWLFNVGTCSNGMRKLHKKKKKQIS